MNSPENPPPVIAVPSSGKAPSLVAARARALRLNPALAPGGAEFASLARDFLPLVLGAAQALIPSHPEAAPRIAAAVLESFALRWRRISRRALLAPWLLRTARFAAAHERKNLGLLPASADLPVAPADQMLLRLARLPAKLGDAVLLRRVLQVSAANAASALRAKEPRVEKQAAAGVAQLQRKLRKRHPSLDVPAALAGLLAAPAPEIEEAILAPLSAWKPASPKPRLARQALRSWSWFHLRGFVRRAATAFATILAALVCFGLAVNWLAQRGYLNDFFFRMQSRDMAKNFPGITDAAKPWAPAAALAAPQTSAELYVLTNIWPATLTFAADEWEKIEPSRVQPVGNLMQPDGTMNLRNPNAKRSGLAGSVGLEFNWVQARLEFAGQVFDPISARFRGNGTFLNSRFGPKQSFKADLNKVKKGQSLAGLDELNFLNSIPDFSYVRDVLAHRLMRDLGAHAPRTAYAYLAIDRDGSDGQPADPLGLFVLTENIDGDFGEDRFGDKKTPIFKPVTYQLFEYFNAEWKSYAPIYDLKTKAAPEQLQRVIDFARLVSQAGDGEFAARLPEFLDLEAFAAYLAGQVLLSSYDGFLANGQNFYVYLRPESNRFGFVSWDQDHSWGEFGYVGTAETREQASIWQPHAHKFLFLDRVLKVEAFRQLYRARLESALAGIFTEERLFAQVDELAAVIRPAVAAENSFRLERFDLAVSSKWIEGPRESGSPEGPHAPVHQIKRFISNRIQSVRAQLDGKSEGARMARHRF